MKTNLSSLVILNISASSQRIESRKKKKACSLIRITNSHFVFHSVTHLLVAFLRRFVKQSNNNNIRDYQIYEFLVSKETVVLRRWERSKQKFGFIKRVDKG